MKKEELASFIAMNGGLLTAILFHDADTVTISKEDFMQQCFMVSLYIKDQYYYDNEESVEPMELLRRIKNQESKGTLNSIKINPEN